MSIYSARLVAVAAGLLASATALATVPQTVDIDGAMRSNAGGPAADGTYKLTFSLYKDPIGGTAVYTEPVVPVALTNGAFHHLLGSVKPLAPETLANMPQVWLGVTIEGEPELARKPLSSTPFSLRAGFAEGLDCTGCVTIGMLDPKVLQPFAKSADLAKVATTGQYGDLQGVPTLAKIATSGNYADLADAPALAAVAKSGSYADLSGAPDLSVFAKITALASVALTGKYGDLSGTPDLGVYAKSASLANVATTGNYNDLVGAPKLGASCGTGLVLAGFKADGGFDCVPTLDPANLPKDALKTVSNGLLTDVIADSVPGAAPVVIKDNTPTGISSDLTWPDYGTVQAIAVNVDLTNSDTKTIKVELTDPNGTKYVLYDKANAATGLKATYTDKSTLVSGTLSTWVGKNPKGKWSLAIFDTGFCTASAGCDPNKTDGQLNAWSMGTQTLSGKKVQALGGLQFLVSDTDPVSCDSAQAGLTYYNKKFNALYVCNGSQYYPISLVPYGTQQNPAASCNDLLTKVPGTKDGQYYIVVNGTITQVTCDMTTDGGGWTSIANESTADGSGWSDGTLTNATVAGAATQVHGMWGTGGGANKTWSLPPHSQVRIRARYYAVDSWDGESNGAQMYVDGALKFAANKVWNAAGGGNGWNFASFSPAPWGGVKGTDGYWAVETAMGNNGILAHTSTTVKLQFATGLDQDKSDESFAFSHVQVWVK